MRYTWALMFLTACSSYSSLPVLSSDSGSDALPAPIDAGVRDTSIDTAPYCEPLNNNPICRYAPWGYSIQFRSECPAPHGICMPWSLPDQYGQVVDGAPWAWCCKPI